MTSLLREILARKRQEVAEQQAHLPLDVLQQDLASAPPVRDMGAALQRPITVALIAEVKKASPSRGVLLPNFDHRALATTYMANGAAALSILTDSYYFQGDLAFLRDIRQMQGESHPIPMLRKDFIIDPYQVYQARAAGADAILLIVAALNDDDLHDLQAVTTHLGMQALVEVHTEEEWHRARAVSAHLIGINNRDLHTFETHLETTEQLARLLPTTSPSPLLISESGISTPADIQRVARAGASAVLIGEALVTAPDIGARVAQLSGVERPS